MSQMRPPSMFPRQSGFRPPGMFGGMQGMQGQGNSGLGGLLKRLIPGMGQSNPMGGMGGMPGFFNPSQGMNTGILRNLANPTQGMNSGILQNLANPSNLSSMLGNVQKTLKMAESVVPMVQQYGPLMKNIPAMIKMYSAIKSSGTEEEEEEAKEENDTISLSDVTSDDEDTENEKEKEKEKPKAKGNGQSVPKLYI